MATQHAVDEADIRQRIEKLVQAIRAMDLESVKPIYAPDIVSFDIVPPLQHVGAEEKWKNWVDVFTVYQRPLGYEIRDLMVTVGNDVGIRAQPQSDQRHVEEREQDRLLGSMDGLLPEDRRQLAHRA
jgi:ketosteroid isomerase-like protein